MTAAHEESGRRDRPALDQAAVERLDCLLGEAADMSVGIGRLLDEEHLGDCVGALKELRKVLDQRLARAMNVLAGHGEEG